MYKKIGFILALFAGAGFPAGGASADTGNEGPIAITVRQETLNPVSPLLWGQFMELATWSGETGASLAVGASGALREDVSRKLGELAPPLVRFPGGTFLSMGEDYEWQHLIDGAPGRGSRERPKSYLDHAGQTAPSRFGWDELFQLRDRVPFEVIAVVELEDAAAKREPLERSLVENAAGLVAYLNGRVDQDLSPELKRYVEARVSNGHREPYGVKYFQLGNEYFVTHRRLASDGDPSNDLDIEWMAKCFVAYVDAMKAVDPGIKIIADGFYPKDKTPFLDLPGVLERVDLASHHRYWPMGPTTRYPPRPTESGVEADPSAFTPEEWWNRWTTGLGGVDEDGNARVVNPEMRKSLERGIQIAHTEWNWNGWDSEGLEEGRNFHIAMGVGAGAYLNGMIRDGGELALANQSMTIGNGWNIPAIRVPLDAAPFLSPQGQAIAHFRQYACGWRIAHETQGMPRLTLPTFYPPHEEQAFALLDTVVTGDGHGLAIHIVSRAYDDSRAVRIDLSAFAERVGPTADWLQLTPRAPDATLADKREIFDQERRVLRVERSGHVECEVLPQSINTIVVELR